MDRILIFSNVNAGDIPYGNWVAGQDIELHYLVDEKVASSYEGLPRVTATDDFVLSSKTELKARQLVDAFAINKIICRSEKDVLRTAKLRSLYQLKGLQYSDAVLFRNKALMKKHAEANQIPIPDYKVCADALDVYAFANHNGFPIILKPLLESGSTGVLLIHDGKELEDILGSKKTTDFPLLAESYIEGDLYHIDSLVLHDEYIFSSVSKYTYQPLSFKDVSSRGSYLLDAENPLYKQLEDFVHKVIRAFPLIAHSGRLILLLGSIWIKNFSWQNVVPTEMKCSRRKLTKG